MPPKEDPEIAKLTKELEELIDKIKAEQKKVADTTLEAVTGEMADPPKVKLSTKKMLKGHIGKVNSVHYSGDSRHAVSGSLDGKLIIWDTWTGNKIQVIPLRSSWVMTVAFSPSGNFVACGGMDNMCTIYDVNNRDSSGTAKIVRELLGYEGFLSSCRFLDDSHIVTGSGDMKLCHWDLETFKKTHDFPAHNGDVVSISLAPDNSTYVTGSVDQTCKLWDAREPSNCKQQFWGHTADVNSVCFHPSGQAFATGSEDKTARMYDLRSDQQLAQYKAPNDAGFTSCALSFSGRYILCGGLDNSVHIWDAMKNQHNTTLTGHENRITSLSLSPNGMALASASWDQNEGRARIIVILYAEVGPTENHDEELQAYVNINTYVKWGDPKFLDKLRYALPHLPKRNVVPDIALERVNSKNEVDYEESLSESPSVKEILENLSLPETDGDTTTFSEEEDDL